MNPPSEGFIFEKNYLFDNQSVKSNCKKLLVSFLHVKNSRYIFASNKIKYGD